MNGLELRHIPALAGLALIACSGAPPAFHGTVYDPPQQAPAVHVDRPGGAFDLADLEGKAVLLFFGYTNCPDVCPLTLARWVDVKRDLGDAADGVAFVMVSVDPARDTPDVISAFVHRFDADFIGLSPTLDGLAAMQDAYHITSMAAPADSAGAATVMHSARMFLIDPEGRLRITYPSDAPAADVAADVRTLLDR